MCWIVSGKSCWTSPSSICLPPSASSLHLVGPVPVPVEVSPPRFLCVAVLVALHADTEEEVQQEHGDSGAHEHRPDQQPGLLVARDAGHHDAGHEDCAG